LGAFNAAVTARIRWLPACPVPCHCARRQPRAGLHGEPTAPTASRTGLSIDQPHGDSWRLQFVWLQRLFTLPSWTTRGCRLSQLWIEIGRISINATGGSRANTLWRTRASRPYSSFFLKKEKQGCILFTGTLGTLRPSGGSREQEERRRGGRLRQAEREKGRGDGGGREVESRQGEGEAAVCPNRLRIPSSEPCQPPPIPSLPCRLSLAPPLSLTFRAGCFSPAFAHSRPPPRRRHLPPQTPRAPQAPGHLHARGCS
jgi:hypothetical protein